VYPERGEIEDNGFVLVLLEVVCFYLYFLFIFFIIELCFKNCQTEPEVVETTFSCNITSYRGSKKPSLEGDSYANNRRKTVEKRESEKEVALDLQVAGDAGGVPSRKQEKRRRRGKAELSAVRVPVAERMTTSRGMNIACNLEEKKDVLRKRIAEDVWWIYDIFFLCHYFSYYL
jgi:hypothetical protein